MAQTKTIRTTHSSIYGRFFSRLTLLLMLTFFLSGLALFVSTGSVEAITKPDAKEVCKRKLDQKACQTRVDACRANDNTCLLRAVRLGQSVHKDCITAPNPQTCHSKVEADCKSVPAAERARCKTEAAKKYNPNAAGASAEIPKTLLNVADAKYQCGNLKDSGDNVKTQINLGCQGVKAKPGTGPIEDMAFAFIKFLSIGVGLVLVASVIYAGIQYSSSGGSAEETSKAKNRIQNAIIGLVFYLLIFAFVQYLVPGGLFN